MTRFANDQARSEARLAEIRVIAARLNEQASSLAPDLLPNGHWEGGGRFWRVGDLDNSPGQALAVNCTTPNIGMWTNFRLSPGAPDRSGDMLALVAKVRYGGRLADAIAWARSTLGMDDMDPERLATETARVAAAARTASEEARRKAEKMVKLARGLFLDHRAVPIADTPAEDYLAGRGIDLSCLEVNGVCYSPRALAFHPAVHCVEVKQDLPALLGRVLDADGVHIATHRIYLARNSAGIWDKAPLVQPKMALGAFGGGYIPLWKGACRKTLREIDPGTDVYTAEGIENGLSVACARPELRCIAAISLGNIGNIRLPEQAGRMVIIRDNDPPGSDADKGMEAAIAKQIARGQAVAQIRMPEGFKDANDVLKGVAQKDSGMGEAA